MAKSYSPESEEPDARKEKGSDLSGLTMLATVLDLVVVFAERAEDGALTLWWVSALATAIRVAVIASTR